jgi:hypothetical protein
MKTNLIIQQLKTPIVIATCLIVYLGFILWGDYVYGILAHPVAYLFVILLGIATILPGLRISKTRRISAIILAIFMTIVIGLNFISLSPIRQFNRLFYDIQPGMARSEVQRLMQSHFVGSKYYPACFPIDRVDSDPDDMTCSLKPHSNFSNQSIEVYYKKQRVVKTNKIISE